MLEILQVLLHFHSPQYFEQPHLKRKYRLHLAFKEGFKLLDYFLWCFFWKVMTTIQNIAFHGVVRNLTPSVQNVIIAEHQVGIAPKN
jgi:hypothetical protein